jgi:PAS domain S-box-containing protein
LPKPLALALAILLSAAIFIVDTFTALGFAIAVLYTLVVIVASSFLDRRGTLFVGGLCIALTIIGFFAGHTLDETMPLARAIISILAVFVATGLTIKNMEKTEALAAQAALLELTHDAIFTRTPENIITFWNRGAAELYGWTAEEAVGRRVSDLLKDDSPAIWDEANRVLLATGRWEGEVQRTRRNGDLLDVACRWSLQRDGHGRALAIMETHNDVTARALAERDLDRARAELFHVSRVTALGELTASIAHEVNQPLAAVIASGEASLRWLRRDEPDLGEAITSIDRIIHAGRRASQVTARLRALARQSNLEHAPLGVDEMIDEVVMLVSRELAQHDVTLNLTLDAGNAQILGDRVQLQQVLINLIINGIQAMDGNGERPREMRVATSRIIENGKDAVLIEVRDTGPGFSAEDAQKLFTAFFTTKPQGMGIGLSICRRIVEAHAGRIWPARGEPGGAIFSIALPIHQEADA